MTHLRMFSHYFTCNQAGVVTEAGDSFCIFTEYLKEEIIGKTVNALFADLLRISSDYSTSSDEAEAILFTNSLQARFVQISKSKQIGGMIFYLHEIPDSRLEDRDPYLEQLIKENEMGIGVYTSALVLIKANQTYLNCLPDPFKSKGTAYGRNIREITAAREDDSMEKKLKDVIASRQSLYSMEKRGFLVGDNRFWDNTITPVIINGQVKYLVSVLRDVTEKVIDNVIMTEQKEQYEALLDHMSDGLISFDKDGDIIHMNKSVEDLRKKYDINFATEKYYGINGTEISRDSLPRRKLLDGKEVEKQILMIKRSGKSIYFECDGSTINDSKGSFKLGILNYRNITQTVEYENKIRIQKEELSEALAFKDEFLYLITHEMKTPLAVINSALQAMNIVCGQMPAKAVKYLKTIQQNTNRQLRLVNNLLDIAKINSGNIRLNNDRFDIVRLTNLIVLSIQPIAMQKDVRVDFISRIKKNEILIDEEKVERILLNLLSNALKFTPRNKAITVTVYGKTVNKKAMVCISIHDQGIGIPKDKQSVIFERFGQVSSSLSRPSEGAGIGLYLVKLLVDAMGGVILLDSEEGIGSNFTLMLPGTKPSPCDEVSKERPLSGDDSRLINELAIQFSDIYF